MNKTIYHSLSFLILSLLSVLGLGQATLPQSLKDSLTTMADEAHIGICIQGLRSKTPIFSYNGHLPFTPGSIQKLWTAGALLEYYGLEHQFSTHVYQRGETWHLDVRDSVAQNSPDLTQLFTQALQHPEATPPKKIVVHCKAFPTGFPSLDPSWMLEDVDMGEATHAIPWLLDENHFIASCTAGAQVGAPADILFNYNPQPPYSVVSRVTTTAPGTQKQIRYDLIDDAMVVQGTLPIGQTKELLLPVYDLEAYFKVKLEAILHTAGILSVPIEFVKTAPAKESLLASLYSPTLGAFLPEVFRTNTVPAALWVRLANDLAKGSPPTQWGKLQDPIRNFLKEQSYLQLEGVHFQDGAGLSRYNRFSPEHLTRFLIVFFQRASSNTRDAFLKSLKQKERAPIWYKTGTLTGVKSLTGYFKARSGAWYAFTIMANGYAGSGRDMQDWQYTWIQKFSNLVSDESIDL